MAQENLLRLNVYRVYCVFMAKLKFAGTQINQRAKRNFGYIPEIPAPYENLTVMEHLEFIGRAYQVSDWEQKARKC